MNLEIWNNEQLSAYIDTKRLRARERVHGFKFLCADTVIGRDHIFQCNPYNQTSNLSQLEVQSDRTLPNRAYDRHLVTLDAGQVIGIISFAWTNALPQSSDQTFWRNYLRFIEVSRTERRKGIATTMIEKLDQLDFIQGKVLQISGYTKHGKRILKPKLQAALKAQNYAVIPITYTTEIPKGYGWY